MYNVGMISKMPSQELLEDFLRGLHGNPQVIFNIEKGEFIRVVERDNSQLERSISNKND